MMWFLEATLLPFGGHVDPFLKVWTIVSTAVKKDEYAFLLSRFLLCRLAHFLTKMKGMSYVSKCAGLSVCLSRGCNVVFNCKCGRWL
mmetsp:Transcript_6010/g.9358  ORF Transcript_6010/g.9358 Transcript_6010/m.9358 type:complete len:87 (-) Transcript_6010:67-327(-)